MSKFDGEFWDDKYSSCDCVYGLEPNKFFKNELEKLKPGRILLTGEGEGRNAVFAASLGWQVDAVDFSKTAKQKALEFAKKNSVVINYEVADLSTYNLKTDYYDAVALIFNHLKPDIRKKIHSSVFNSLKPNGKIILEAFEKEQLGKNSGGPQNIDMLYSVHELAQDFEKLTVIILEKKIIALDESKHHKGEAVVVRVVAVKN
jgi:SAM-dependent methyltransferase